MIKKNNKRKYLYLLIIPALLLAYVGISRIYYNRITERSVVNLTQQDYYIITSKGCNDSLIIVMSKDSNVFITYPADSAFLNTITTHYQGLWVNKYWFSSCQGCVAVKETTTNENLLKIEKDSINTLITKQKQIIEKELSTYQHQQKEIDYYFGSHQLADEGFDVVIRRKATVDHAIDSLKRISKIINLIDSLGSAQLSDRHIYRADGKRCTTIKSHHNGYNIFQTTTRHTPDNARPVYIGALSSGRYSVKEPYFPKLPSDTTYIGKRDSAGQYTGKGILNIRTKLYYEGEFANGEPDGFGVAFDKRVRAGKWVHGRYRGEIPTYTDNHVYGIDISRYQHESANGKKHWGVNWNNVHITSLGNLSRKNISGNGRFHVSFVFIKATQSNKLKNKYYYSDYRNARNNGLRVGSYHFFSTKVSPEAQAAFFLTHSRYQKGDLPPVLDLEPTSAQIRKFGGINTLLWAARVWMETVERHRGVKPILYVSHIFFNRYLSDDSTNRLTKKYDVWISRYGQYKPIGHLRFWQLCPDGHVSGFHGQVDINIFNGNKEAFRKYNR